LPERAQLLEYLGSERDGGFAEYVAVPGINAHSIGLFTVRGEMDSRMSVMPPS
jgi:threonine dehydrogenase-like Zn-dependent dehydrogenase